MCAKCHDLANQVIKNTSWNQHALHINAGFSCSVCHTAHGTGGTNPNIGGQRLINFDAKRCISERPHAGLLQSRR